MFQRNFFTSINWTRQLSAMRRFVFRRERLRPLLGICLLLLVVFLFCHVGRSPVPDLQKHLALKLPPSIFLKLPSVSNNSFNKTIGLRERIEEKLSRNLARSTRVKPRKNMEKCLPIYGKVGVFVAVDEASYDLTKRYAVAQESLRCYLKSTNYSFFYVNVDTDPRTLAECKQKEVVFRKHCAASVYLRDVDWMLVLDADTGVVNPNHCIEEWIDDRVDMIFYERFYHFEIACGNYLVRNTQQAHDFLVAYADLGNVQYGQFDASDNGRLLLHILRTVLPEATEEIGACESIYREAKSFETYLKFVTCVKYTLGAVRVFPGVVRIYRRAHSWVRDYQLTNGFYGPNDFMMHSWKPSKVNFNDGGYEINVFKKMPDLEKCGTGGLNGWHFNPRYATSTEDIKRQLASYEQQTQQWFPKEARYLPFLIKPETANCYPHCDVLT